MVITDLTQVLGIFQLTIHCMSTVCSCVEEPFLCFTFSLKLVDMWHYSMVICAIQIVSLTNQF